MEIDRFDVCVQAQKELLDAELDFHKKMSSGEDTTDLKRKLGQLQVEVIKDHSNLPTALFAASPAAGRQGQLQQKISHTQLPLTTPPWRVFASTPWLLN